MKKIFQFDGDCGRMGSVVGTFVATQEEVDAAVGKTACFGEILGKHSEIDWGIEAGDITVVTDDQDFVAKAEEYKLVPVGYNPLEYLREEEEGEE